MGGWDNTEPGWEQWQCWHLLMRGALGGSAAGEVAVNSEVSIKAQRVIKNWKLFAPIGLL